MSTYRRVRTLGRHTVAPLASIMLLALVAARSAHAAPESPAPRDTACTYQRCALAVVPAWNGLDLVRGESEERVGRLGFFWANDVSPMFAGEPQALEHAQHAVRLRRVGALFTDLGAALLVAAAVGGLTDQDHADTYRGLAIGGAFAVGISVPFQFAADGHLSRAVWWHNAQFAR
jgi:hypothetical protein